MIEISKELELALERILENAGKMRLEEEALAEANWPAHRFKEAMEATRQYIPITPRALMHLYL